MAENPGLTSHRAYDPEGSHAEGANPYLPAKGGAWVFQSKPPSFIRSEGSLDMGRSTHPTPSWHHRPGHSLVEPAFQRPLRSHVGSLCRLTLRANSAQVTKGQHAAFPTFSVKLSCVGETKPGHARRESSCVAQWEGEKILEAPERFGFEPWLCHARPYARYLTLVRSCLRLGSLNVTAV